MELANDRFVRCWTDFVVARPSLTQQHVSSGDGRLRAKLKGPVAINYRIHFYGADNDPEIEFIHRFSSCNCAGGR